MPYKNPKDHPRTEEQKQRYRAKDAESKRSKYVSNPEKQKSATLKYKYKMTLDDYDRMLEQQGGVCALCSSPEPEGRGRFHVDHDHLCCPTDKTCGKCIRGLLCSPCNVRLGVLENTLWVEKAQAYLKNTAIEDLRAALLDTTSDEDGTEDVVE